jgi:hypothetical protein
MSVLGRGGAGLELGVARQADSGVDSAVVIQTNNPGAQASVALDCSQPKKTGKNQQRAQQRDVRTAPGVRHEAPRSARLQAVCAARFVDWLAAAVRAA